ncbi:MAG: transglycosylase SLT domain-containing protein [Gammaproteobacteria bacterium]|nr:transglycosylase SLT domain-containing protein [Gammaproteobacteria bacterium]
MLRTVFLSLALLCCANASAKSPSTPPADPPAAQRSLFAQAHALQQKGERPLWLMQRLESYPLHPYLVYGDLSRRLATASEVEVAEFLDKYADTPLSDALRLQWLRYLASKGRPAAFLKFDRPLKDKGLDCWRLRMRLAGGYPRQDVYKDLARLWQTGQSLPDSCDALIKDWRRAGGLSDALLWTRLELAAQAGNTDLIIYLRGIMPKREQYMADLWRAALTSPSTLTSSKYFKGKSPKEREILNFGLKRYAREDSLKALAMYERIKKRFHFNEEQDQEILRGLALAMSGGSRPQAEEFLAKVKDKYTDGAVREWRVRYALRAGDWAEALFQIERMPKAQQDEDVWRYWRGRALLELKDPRAHALLNSLAQGNHYHGFLAAHALGHKPRLPKAPTPFTEADKSRVANQPALRRARELFVLHRLWEARREWNHAFTKLDDRDEVIAAGLAVDWGWFDRPVFSLRDNAHPDALFLRFPLAYEKAMVRESRKQAIDPAWAYAITRQESAFIPEARSGVGAIGLMQLMPYTAKHIAKTKKLKYKSPDELENPDTNIRFGTVYLRQVLDSYGGNPILATASYNAGPNRVRKWLPEAEGIPAEVWVELIPYKETRQYVKNVLSFSLIYANRLGLLDQSVLMDLKRHEVAAAGASANRQTAAR